MEWRFRKFEAAVWANSLTALYNRPAIMMLLSVECDVAHFRAGGDRRFFNILTSLGYVAML